ncbi:MAG: DNA repair protein RecO [Nitrosomonadales bacterium]|nr:DNA repair protein RecO [Nitrosomonadales bacterium]|tara:strand:+ start:60 stop:779 length:720 start_codon:yes stop_codon:yes gene_type:complete
MISTNKKKENESIYVLHTYPFKETSLIAELFSKNYGRISVIAKGARRPRSSLRGMLQSFQLLQATWSGKKEIKTLHSIEWCDKFLSFKGGSLLCGFYINELLIRLLPREDTHQKLFEFYDQTMKTLEKDINLDTALRRFELNLLQELGYEVPLKEDENGDSIIPDKFYIYEAEYGPSEISKTNNGVKIFGKTLLDMANDEYKEDNTQLQSKQLMRYLINYYLGDKPLNSKKLFTNIKDN